MKILAALTLILLLAVGSLGYIDYRQVQDINVLQIQISALTQEVVGQHAALVSQKKAIIDLRSDQKKITEILALIIQSLEPDSSPKSEQNSYTRSNQVKTIYAN